ncbi:MAG: hypothetical protein VKO64_05345 [Candidatus Sericytochromatia bacterium]|nr:hypothetical protein [Candidatus Sericytochromatia bacterium]
MKSAQLIDRVLRPRKLDLSLADDSGVVCKVAIRLPDLGTATRNMSGEWGPCYSIDIPLKTAVTVEAKWGTEAAQRIVLRGPRKLQVESPMLAETRERLPLYIDLPLPGSGRRLWLHFDGHGHLAEASVTRPTETNESTKPLVAILPEGAGRPAWFLAHGRQGRKSAPAAVIATPSGKRPWWTFPEPGPEVVERFERMSMTYAAGQIGEERLAELMQRGNPHATEAAASSKPVAEPSQAREPFGGWLAKALQAPRLLGWLAKLAPRPSLVPRRD